MGAEKHPLLVSTSELFLPRDGQRRKPETTLPRAQPQHSGLKSLPSLSPSTPTARTAAVQVPERRTKGSIRHDTFWHWQSQDSGMVLVPTVQSVRRTRHKQTRSIKQAGELEKVRLPALTSAAALKGPGPGGCTEQSKSGTTTPPSATTSWSVESRLPDGARLRRKPLDVNSTRYSAVAVALMEARLAKEQQYGQEGRESKSDLSGISEEGDLTPTSWERIYDEPSWWSRGAPRYPESQPGSRGSARRSMEGARTWSLHLDTLEQAANEDEACESTSRALSVRSPAVRSPAAEGGAAGAVQELSSFSLLSSPKAEARFWQRFMLEDPGVHETTDDDSIQEVFRELQEPVDHLILCEQVPLALEKLGYRDVNLQWAEEIRVALAGDCSFMQLEEFKTAVRAYRSQKLDAFCNEFRRCREEHGGAAPSVNDLVALLAKHDIQTLACLVQELLEEVNGESSAEITAADYVLVREMVQYKGGFTKREIDEAFALFNRYDANGSGDMDKKELESALRWLGFSFKLDDDSAASAESDKMKAPDVDALLGKLQGDCVHFEEFLQVMRRYREWEIGCAKRHFAEQAAGAGTIDAEGAASVICKLGYPTANAALIKEIAHGQERDDIEKLTLDDVYMVFREVRRTEGFSQSEVLEFKSAFEAHDTNSSGAVDVVELGGVLRWMGYYVTVEMQQEFLDEVDIDKSGELDFDEFLKILRWYRESELRQLKQAFATGDEDNNGQLDPTEVACLLVCLGWYPLSQDQERLVNSITRGREVNFRDCARMIEGLRALSRDSFRISHGFARSELQQLRKEFEAVDKDRSGFISKKEIVTLYEKYCPASIDPQQARNIFTDMLSQVDEDGDGSLHWLEFLHLMRLLQDRADYETVLSQQEAAARAGFSRDELKDLRKIFKICDSDASRALDVDELLKALTSVMPMSFSMREEVRRIFKEVDEDGSCSLDFPEFLMVMHKVQESHIYMQGSPA